MNASNLKVVFLYISNVMTANRDYLIKLDQKNGDGDLGISMTNGYRAVSDYLSTTNETDLGKLMMKSSLIFNEAAPSSLGTIMSFAMVGMAQSLRGKVKGSLMDIAQAMQSGVDKIMEKTGSKLGEKTVLDSLCPGIDALISHANHTPKDALKAALVAAQEGAENTKKMRAVHGRAAYYGDKSIGVIDSGAVAGSLLFEALYQYITEA
ncbi:MAG: dihydroxyacetone kinase subunit L [Oscillospiraceae bacterium]|jgi:dihydroxyacetone kinase-like protein|nr:dihydroxyacetone kinase subunit L [Oscillospiraceae bacterium]